MESSSDNADSETAATAAVCHYQSRRYHLAALEFERAESIRNKCSQGATSEIYSRSGDEDHSESCSENDVGGGWSGCDVIGTNPSSTVSENRTRKRKHPSAESLRTDRIELVALPHLAQRADLAMCRFRASQVPKGRNTDNCGTSNASSSTTNPGPRVSVKGHDQNATKSSSQLLAAAIDANKTYRIALGGAATSLIQTCGIEIQRLQRRRRQQKLVSSQNIQTQENLQIKQFKSLHSSIKSTSMAILMSAIAASHLYLHKPHSYDTTGDVSISDTRISSAMKRDRQGFEDAWNVLVDSCLQAADLILFRKEWADQMVDFLFKSNSGSHQTNGQTSKHYGNLSVGNVDEKSGNEQADKTIKTSSALENALLVLNESLCKHSTVDGKTVLTEDERGIVALNSFRSALKVAALATGRVILPTSQPFQSTSEVDGTCSRAESDTDVARSSNLCKQQHEISSIPHHNEVVQRVWNTLHPDKTDPSLHSREKFVDALSFHVASARYSRSSFSHSNPKGSVSETESSLVGKRDMSLKVAEELESKSAQLCNISGLSASGGFAGYVWKIRNCISAMDMVYHAQNSTSNFSCGTSFDNNESNEKVILQSLKKLTASSQYACDLLGCIFAQKRDYSRAIEMFQSSLELGGSKTVQSSNKLGKNLKSKFNEVYYDADTDEELSNGVAEYRTIMNMALCFLALGDVKTPVELLLYIWGAESSGISTGPAALMLSRGGEEIEYSTQKRNATSFESMRLKLLWFLFQSSSLAQDWATCLGAVEELMDLKKHQSDSLPKQKVVNIATCHDEIAYSFALLQCRQSSQAQKVSRKLIAKLMKSKANNESSMTTNLHFILANLYFVDSFILSEQNISTFDKADMLSVESLSSPVNSTKRCLEVLSAISAMLGDHLLVRELSIIMHNNHGVSLILDGDSIGALRHFREATSMCYAAPSKDSNSSISIPSWLILPTYFNLSLLLLRDGHIEESAKSWLHARGHLLTWENAIKGNKTELKRLRDIHIKAVNCHGLLMAKRSMARESNSWDQENVMEWVPPTIGAGEVKEDSSHLSGVDASQITALDSVLLRYAVSFAEKKGAAKFRSITGSVAH